MTTPLGKTNYRGRAHRFGIKRHDRRRHIYVIGKTGMGKSTLLENIAASDIQSGEGVGIIDPHGDLAESLLHRIPKERVEETVYLNPADREYPFGLNILEQPSGQRDVAASAVISVFKKLWSHSWGPRMEHILRNAVLTLLGIEGTTLLDLQQLLTDAEYRHRIVRNLSDPELERFWREEFEEYSRSFRSKAIAPIQNKVGQFTSSPVIRNIVGQESSTVDLSTIMDEGKILLVNLSKGQIGADSAALLGALIVTQIQLEALRRATRPPEERPDFYLHVDEFQHFATDSFASILSEARKYRLGLTLAHQHLGQLDPELQQAVFGNVGTIISFRTGAEDAQQLSDEFHGRFEPGDFLQLPQGHVYVKLTVDGVGKKPFSAQTLPPKPQPDTSFRDGVVEHCRRQHSTAGGDGEGLRETQCWQCQEKTTVPFEPDERRPIFCSNCYQEAQSLKNEGEISSIPAFLIYKEEGAKAAQRWEERGAPIGELTSKA